MKAEEEKFTKQLSKDGGGIELGLAAIVFGLLGFWLDSKIGSTPVLFIGFFLFGFLGGAFSAYYKFKEQMRILDEEADSKGSS